MRERREGRGVMVYETAGAVPASISREDISAIEALSDAAIRSGDTQTAVTGYALALRLRSETGLWPQRRKDDQPVT